MPRTLNHALMSLCLCMLAALAACSDDVQRLPAEAAAAPVAYAKLAAAAGQAPEPAPASVRRYLALRHDLHIQTPADDVEAAWRNASEACAAAGCEVLAARLERNDELHPAEATLVARVPPDRLDAFLARVSALGSVGRHAKTSEDKTDEVIDTEARIANMTGFRDNLRRLMATPGSRLKDLIEVERELVRVQSELDSLASRRKALAGETDKVHVTLNFSARPAVLATGMWAPVREAVLGAGRTFARSAAALISLLVAVLPWLVLLAGLGVALRAAWRRRRQVSA
jgi:hypothetical protein